MSELTDLPELGVGFVYWPSLEGLLDLEANLIDVLEVEPQPFWFAPSSSTMPYHLDQRAFDHLRDLPQPKLVHGVGSPIGGTTKPDPRQITALRESIGVLGAAWASEHLSFSKVPRATTHVDVGFLLPPIQSLEGVAVGAANIAAIQAQLSVPFAFETGVSYLRPLAGELSDGAFFAAVAQTADCGILLDLHNVWANERNGRQPVLQLVAELPLERVVELHLAGGQDYDGYWVDAHSDLIPAAVMDIARWVVPRLPNLKAIIYEVMPEYVVVNDISTGQLVEQFWELRELWDMRASGVAARERTAPAVQSNRAAQGLPTPRAWEDALAAAVTTSGRSADVGLVRDLRKDPGTAVLNRLIRAVRAGKVADTLTLSTRLLLLTLGEQGLQGLLDDYWSTMPPQQMASDEAAGFAAYLVGTAHGTRVRHLHEVVAFELATHRAVMTCQAQNVEFSHDPGPLLSALRKGRLPPALAPGHFAVTVSPPRAGAHDQPRRLRTCSSTDSANASDQAANEFIAENCPQSVNSSVRNP